MIALIQRVRRADVTVGTDVVGAIGGGMLVLLGVEAGDTPAELHKLADKVLKYRLFSDEAGKMNMNVQQAGGQLLVVSQFTLAADTRSGLRPSFTPAAAPVLAEEYYLQFCQHCRDLGLMVATGRFAADMQVSLINDGPVTIQIDSKNKA